MRRLLPVLVAAVVTSVAGCATVSQPVSLGLVDDTEPIDAVINDVSWRGVRFYVNQPAHVAVFEIVPGRGVSLLFPQYASQTNFVRGGFYTSPRGLQSGRLFYQSVSPFDRYPEPRYYFLIASRYPLALGQMLSSAGAVRSVLGWQRFTGRDAYGTMELLSRAIVPAYDAEAQSDSWISDVYVVWPSSRRYSSVFSSYDAFRCSNGRVVLGAWDYIPDDCFSRVASGPSEPAPVTPAPTDTIAMPDTGSKRRHTETGPPDGQPADRQPRQFLPVSPGDAGSEERIADRETAGRRGPRRTGRVAFESDPGAAERRFTDQRRGLAGGSAEREEGLRRVVPTWRDARISVEHNARQSSRRASESNDSPSAGAESRSVTRGHSRAEPKSTTRDQPQKERRSEPRSQPKAEPRSSTPRSSPSPSASRVRKPHDDAR